MGFTLAELLIALSMLGIIATFTIPKLLNNTANNQKTSVLRETISTLSEAIYTGTKTNQFTGTPASYFLNTLNAYKQCPANANTEGCWSHVHFDGLSNYPGMILHNGATVNFSPTTSGSGGQMAGYLYIDWNGADAPNTHGNDQMVLCYSHGQVTWLNGGGWGTIKSGQIIPCQNHASSINLYNQTFAN